jgi:hypothetical protein
MASWASAIAPFETGETAMQKERTPKASSAPATGASQASDYQVAPLPQAEVEKLQRVERELTEDTGEEIVVVAYKKQRR